MTRITKQTAEKVSLILAEKKQKKVSEAKKVMEEYITELCEAKTPLLVHNAFEHHKRYIKTSSYCYLQGAGIQRFERVNAVRQVPCEDGNLCLELNAKQSERFIKLNRDWQKEKTEYEKLLQDIQVALIRCGTYANVSKNFPEAVPHLPIVYPTPAIDYKEIRSKISK